MRFDALAIDKNLSAQHFNQDRAVTALPDVPKNAFAGARQRRLLVVSATYQHLWQEHGIHGADKRNVAAKVLFGYTWRRSVAAQNIAQPRSIRYGARSSLAWLCNRKSLLRMDLSVAGRARDCINKQYYAQDKRDANLAVGTNKADLSCVP